MRIRNAVLVVALGSVACGTNERAGQGFEVAKFGRGASFDDIDSDGDTDVLVGLGASTQLPRVRVVWLDGRQEEWSSISVDRWTALVQGSGR